PRKGGGIEAVEELAAALPELRDDVLGVLPVWHPERYRGLEPEQEKEDQRDATEGSPGLLARPDFGWARRDLRRRPVRVLQRLQARREERPRRDHGYH